MRSRATALVLAALMIGGTGAGAIATGGGGPYSGNASCAQYRPGNGNGDTNHTHVGPPGQGSTPPPGCTGPGNSQNAPGHN